jgi:hypothetical protein
LHIRRLVQLLRSKIPDTYGVVESVRSEYGDMPVHKEKGEGGTSNLEKRIAVNFYNKFLRLVNICLFISVAEYYFILVERKSKITF